ncbi:hypothetical protein BGX28_002498 [Mortierella sp. GBA30]|nr:hypothetical protein BGX28_002498 [Mortierella sp. GBA30]
MHTQHGFHGNFHQPPMMPLGNHPMAGPFNIGPPPFGGNGFSPSLLGAGSNHTTDISPTEGSMVNANASPDHSDLPGLVNNNSDLAPSPPQFDSSPAPSLGISAVSTGAASFPTSGTLHQTITHPGSPSTQHYAFLAHLGPISKPNPVQGSGLLSGASDILVDAGSEGDFVPLDSGNNPYHFGSSDNTNGDDALDDGSGGLVVGSHMYGSLPYGHHRGFGGEEEYGVGLAEENLLQDQQYPKQLPKTQSKQEGEVDDEEDFLETAHF